jgi:hypothetical protein
MCHLASGNMIEVKIPGIKITKDLYKKKICDKEKCGKEGIYSSKLGSFCLDHILDYDMPCPNDDCPQKGVAMAKLVPEIKQDLKGDLHQIFLCQSCGYRHDHTVHV